MTSPAQVSVFCRFTWWNHEPFQEKISSWTQLHSPRSGSESACPPTRRSSERVHWQHELSNSTAGMQSDNTTYQIWRLNDPTWGWFLQKSYRTLRICSFPSSLSVRVFRTSWNLIEKCIHCRLPENDTWAFYKLWYVLNDLCFQQLQAAFVSRRRGSTEPAAGRPVWGLAGDTHLARALKEWLKDFAAKWSSVCRNTSIFRGLKPSPSSGQKREVLLHTENHAFTFTHLGDHFIQSNIQMSYIKQSVIRAKYTHNTQCQAQSMKLFAFMCKSKL